MRRNSRVRISQRTTLAHWLMRIGRSRYDCTHLAYIAPMIVSQVGRTTSGSSSLPGGHELAVGSGLEAMMRDDGAFLGEALDVLGLLFQKAQRDEQREIGVLMAGLLEHPIEHALHVFPEGIAPRLDHHAAAHGGILGQIGRP